MANNYISDRTMTTNQIVEHQNLISQFSGAKKSIIEPQQELGERPLFALPTSEIEDLYKE
jgi:hypothetical protein